jgi:Cu-processing system permease protein
MSFAGLFSILTLLIAYFGMVTSGYAGFQDFTRTSASIVNLAGFLIPLFALLLGVFSFITNTEYLELMVTQPVARSRILLGRYFGLVTTVLGASVIGFGLPGVIISLVIGPIGAIKYLLVIGYAFLLAIVFTGLSLLISLLAGRKQIALGIALAVWIFYEVVFGVLILGTTLYLSPGPLKLVLTVGLLGNPIDTIRVLSLLQIGGLHLFGPAGATLLKMTGSATMASLYGLLGVLLWIVVPVYLSIRIFRRQDL